MGTYTNGENDMMGMYGFPGLQLGMEACLEIHPDQGRCSTGMCACSFGSSKCAVLQWSEEAQRQVVLSIPTGQAQRGMWVM